MAQNGDNKKYRILHVDDNIDALGVLKLKLSRNFEIYGIDDSRNVLDFMAGRELDIVVTDYEMPYINGLELLKLIREKYPKLPVIFYTGQGNEEVAREAFMAGVSDYLTKSSFEIAHWEKLVNSINNAVERKKVGEMIEESERKLTTLIQNIPGLVYRCKNDRDWTMEFVSEYSMELTGYAPEDFLRSDGVKYAELILPEYREYVWNEIQKQLGQEKPYYLEYRIKCREGRTKYVVEYGTPVYGKTRELIALEGVIMDDSERKKAEIRTRHLNRILIAVSEINQLIVREKSREALLKKACEILKRAMNYSLVWIGLTDPDDEHVTPASFEGDEEGYLSGLLFASHNDDRESNPVYGAILTGKPVIQDDLSAISTNKTWAEEALKRGHHSLAAIPLVCRGNIYGTLAVYAPEKKYFDDKEVSLLLELGNDISFALKALEDQEVRKKSEDAVRESEARYHALFEQANDAVYLETLSGRILDANEIAGKMLGYTKEEILSMRVVDLLPQEWREQLPALTNSLIKEGRFFVESLNLKKDGTKIPVEVSGSLLDIGGEKCLITIVRDITERKNAMKTAERSKITIDEAPYGIAMTDLKGNIKIFNREMEKLTGYTAGEIKNIDEWFEKLFPDEIQKNGSLRVWRDNSTEQGFSWENKLTIIRKGGERRILLMRARGLYSGDRIIFLLDITEWENASDALEKSEEKYRVLFEKSGDAVVLIDVESGLIVDANRQAEMLLEKSRKDLIGSHFTKIHPQEEIEKFRENFKKTVESEGKFGDVKVDIVNSRGKHVPVLISGSVMEMNGKRVIQGIFKDITRLEENFKELEWSLYDTEVGFRELAEELPHIVYEATLPDLRMTYMNSISFKTTGFTQEEFDKGIFLHNILGGMEYEKARRRISSLVEGKDTGFDVFVARDKEEREFQVEVFSRVIKKNGRAVGIRGIVKLKDYPAQNFDKK